jgi:hypothetical protein
VSDWSKRVAENIRRSKEAAKVKDERALQEERLLDTHSPAKWKTLCDLAIQKCTELNSEPGMDGLLACNGSNPEMLVIQNSAHRELRILFDSRNYAVFTEGALHKRYQLVVAQGSRNLYFAEVQRNGENGSAIDPERITTEILEAFLGL